MPLSIVVNPLSGLTQDETIEFEGDERTRLLKALEKANGNSTRAAQLLGIGRSTFYRHLEACGISPSKSETRQK